MDASLQKNILGHETEEKPQKYPFFRNLRCFQKCRYRPSDYEFGSNFACVRPPTSFLKYYMCKLQIPFFGTF